MSSANMTGAKRRHDASSEKTDKREFPKRPCLEKKTDLSRWRLQDDGGRLTWHYMLDEQAAKEWPQSDADKWYLGLPLDAPDLPKAMNPLDAATNGLNFFERLQLPTGTWGCEYGGPMFLIPGFVFAWHDGGWGLHIEGESSVFGTAMNYVALRLIGVDAEDPVMVKARGTLHKLGGATHGPHWLKFWFAVLGLVKWEIVNPVPPEIWLLPDWVPIAPWRWWIHIRMVFLPMSYVYSKKWVCEETDVIKELKNELFVEPWAEINWDGNRNSISDMDNYHPKTWLLNVANWFLVKVWNPYLRTDRIKNWAEAWTSELVDMEDANTGYACLAPVNAPLNTLVCYIRDGPDAYSTRRHIERLQEFIWVKDEGMLVNGTNGVQCWDTAFAIQSAMAAGLETDDRWRPMLTKALEFLDNQQIRENCKDQEKCYRQQRKGGWPFSNKDQGYAVSDCISEALKAVILLQKTDGYPQLINDQRIFDAIDTLLVYQNADTGGCASYELRRGGEYMEMLNAAEVFGRIMIEYDYPECTTAWYGSWGICFTYAAMFALESLASVGETYSTSNYSKKGCEFLLSKQREDGGWSESYKACEDMTWHEHPTGSLVVQTAWALIALMEAGYPHVEPLRKGIKLIMDRQQKNGEWLQEAIEGVFNKSCMISYPNYKFTFTIKALGLFSKKFPNEKVV
ncbi:unnamed protein product [Parascedosporium putredinis]|uniref:Terpene cyclase/mutase family member n=1 Tax=Parascedosporium putredinis TaxID=1442378 RepID=A0A9P1M9J1_9PEZI|nr:unnamed protein product [Parascedosporium putredinis]CAI7994914.1 unnamed protein product [Parascedosporium putredinis]